MRKSRFTPILTTLFLNCIFIAVRAQKLPNVQTAGVRAPANIKIDGKVTEWNNQFQAFNRATDIFYTISNDNSKLYFTVQSTDRAVINKIMNGGITFTVQTSGKKTDKGGASITYPLFDRKDTPWLPGALDNRKSGGDEEIMLVDGDGPGDKSKVSENANAIMAYNKRLENAKYIGVSGIKGIDSLLSAYNMQGIKVAQLFDEKMAYTYEMAVDLKLLGLTASSGAKLAYHITVNGENKLAMPHEDAQPVRGGGSFVIMTDPGPAPMATTDMWGGYTLAKSKYF